MKPLALALLLAGALTIAGCETMGDMGGKMMSRAGDKEKIIAGLKDKYEPSAQAVGQERDLMNRRAETLGLFSSPEISRYLNGIHARLVKASGVSGVPGKVYLTADAELNAEATPDGNIYLNWGLLRNLGTEDDVAAVIAHELSHVLLRHHDSNMVSHYQKVAQWYQHAGVATSAALRGMRNNSPAGLKKGEVSQLNNVQALVNLTTKVVLPSYQRSQEREADLLGVDLLVRAGYSPDGMTNVMSVLKQGYDNARRDPNPVQMANLLASIAAGNNQQKVLAGIELLGMAFGEDHPDPQARSDDAGNYLANYYDPADTSPPFQRKPWESVLKSQALRKTVAAYDGAHAARQYLDRGKAKEAYEISRRTIDGARDHAYPAFVHAMTLNAIGRHKEADAIIAHAVEKTPEPSGQVYLLYAESLSAAGRHREALQVVEKGRARLGDAPQMVPLIVRYQRLSGDTNRANATASECARVHTGYRERCFAENTPAAQAPGQAKKRG